MFKSCKEILNHDRTSLSGLYWIKTPTGPLQVYCEMVVDGGGYTVSFRDQPFVKTLSAGYRSRPFSPKRTEFYCDTKGKTAASRTLWSNSCRNTQRFHLLWWRTPTLDTPVLVTFHTFVHSSILACCHPTWQGLVIPSIIYFLSFFDVIVICNSRPCRAGNWLMHYLGQSYLQIVASIR